MQRIAQFETVSKTEYEKTCTTLFGDKPCFYEEIKLPKRATTGSAGYDFYTPFDVTLAPKQSIKIPTGIRVKMEEGWVLQIYPRSGLGFKFRLQLDNTVGIIDSDYYFSDNEGHIIIKLTNDTNEEKELSLKKGDGFAQGLFLSFGITQDDNVQLARNGGFGSTDTKQIT